MAVVRSLLCGAAATAAASTLPVPRVVGEYSEYDVEAVLGVGDNAFYAQAVQPREDPVVLTVETLGDWSRNMSFRTTHTDLWKLPAQDALKGYVENAGYLHPIMGFGYAIDVRNKTAGKMVTTGDEVYESLCFFERNGTTYGANTRGEGTEVWIRLFDVRKPNVTVGKVDLPGGQLDESLGAPRCSAKLGLMVVSPWMLDVSDVTAPKVLRRLPMSEKPNEDIDDFALDEQRRVLFTSSDLTLRSWNIENPADPVLIGQYELPTTNVTRASSPSNAPLGGWLHGGFFMHLLDNKLYMGIINGATVVDVSSPESPTTIATLDLRLNGCTSFQVRKIGRTVYGVRAGGTPFGEPHVIIMALHTDE